MIVLLDKFRALGKDKHWLCHPVVFDLSIQLYNKTFSKHLFAPSLVMSIDLHQFDLSLFYLLPPPPFTPSHILSLPLTLNLL